MWFEKAMRKAKTIDFEGGRRTSGCEQMEVLMRVVVCILGGLLELVKIRINKIKNDQAEEEL